MDALSLTTAKGLYSRLKRDVKVRDHRVRYLVWRLRKVCPWIGESDLPAARAVRNPSKPEAFGSLALVSALVLSVDVARLGS
jgi:hypothetical protein